MGRKKSITKLMKDPGEMRVSDLIKVLSCLGYTLVRVRGSHFQFKNADGHLITLPIHKNKVQKYYLKYIKKLIIKAELYDQ